MQEENQNTNLTNRKWQGLWKQEDRNDIDVYASVSFSLDEIKKSLHGKDRVKLIVVKNIYMNGNNKPQFKFVFKEVEHIDLDKGQVQNGINKKYDRPKRYEQKYPVDLTDMNNKGDDYLWF